MSRIRLMFLADVLATAERILTAPEHEGCHVSIEERVSLAALVLQQHRTIVEAGIAYPTAPAAGAIASGASL